MSAICLGLLTSTLIACGGGGTETSNTIVPSADEGARAQAFAATASTADTAVAEVLPGIGETLNASPLVGDSRRYTVIGAPETPAPPPPLVFPAGGRTFYVDARSGNDRADGLTERARNGSSDRRGPWSTLARLMQAPIAPGDRIVLACGSVWNETLRLPVDGTPERPIAVTQPEGGCAAGAEPTIDGSVAIAPSQWIRSGQVYRAALTARPLQLFSSTGVMNEAHHPNRGHDASLPQSAFVPLAGNGGTVVIEGRTRSSSIFTGTELVLPTGAKLASGARVRVRTNNWTLEERRITAVDGGKLTLDSPTIYPIVKGWGYFLLGQAWMVDSPGEWSHDVATAELTAWMPDNRAPTAVVYAATLGTGVDLSSRAHIVVSGLTVRRVGTGLDLRRANAVRVVSARVTDTAALGANATGSTGATIESSTFLRTALDAINGVTHETTDAQRLTVRGNIIRDSGVQLLAGVAATLPQRSFAAIYGGSDATIVGNTIVNAGYIGIRFMPRSTVQNNLVYNACLVLDDCGGIYTWGKERNDSRVEGNAVIRLPGNRAGKITTALDTLTGGIYLDDQTVGVRVQGNTVIDADHAVLVHNARDNQIIGNIIYGHRRSGIWFLDDTNIFSPAGDVSGNMVTANQIGNVVPGAASLRMNSRWGGTSSFAHFDGNRYLDRVSPILVLEKTPAGTRSLTWAEWQKSSGVGSLLSADPAGSASSAWSQAWYRVAGQTFITNGALQTDAAGWRHWNQIAPTGTLLREPCAVGMCLRYVPGGSRGVVSSSDFSVQQGQSYRLTVDLRAETDGQRIQLLLRRGGGGSNGYETLSDRDLTVTAGPTWRRYSVVFVATKTVNRRDPITGDNGARIDIEGLVSGASVTFSNMELVPLAPAAVLSAVVINRGTGPGLGQCPFTSDQTALCGTTRLLRNGQPPVWPVPIGPLSAEIAQVQPHGLNDADGDGIPDDQDACPGTPTGASVNSAGCSWAGSGR